MKTLQPKDYSKTPDQYLVDSRMGRDKQVLWYQNGIAKLFVFGFAVWMIAVSVAGLWEIYMGALK